MRVLSCSLLLCCLAASGCFIAESTGPAHPCADDSECPSAYRCVSVSASERSCEVIYPPLSPLEADAGSDGGVVSTSDAGTKPDAGPVVVPTYCKEIKTVLDSSCVSTCHGTTTSGSGRTDFRLDIYAAAGSVKGAQDMASRIQVRAVDQQTMPPKRAGAPVISASERDLLARWVAAGTPLCDGDGGTP